MNTAQVNGLSEAKRRLLRERMAGRKVGSLAGDPIQPRRPNDRIPISAEQYRIWLHASSCPEMPLYNESITIHRRGHFDLAILSAAFSEILRRHEAWRTSFAVVDEELVQVVHSPPRLDLPLVDLSAMPEVEREAEALRLATEDAVLPVALDRELLFRARVVRMAPEDHRLLLTLHHIIFDGVSIYRILMPELASIYAALEAGQVPSLPEPELQYGDYAIWQENRAASPSTQRHLIYWKEVLAGDLPLLALPMDCSRPARVSHRGSMECFQLSAELVAELQTLSQKYGATLYMTLLATFKTLLFRYSAQQDIIVGGVTDARKRPELESLMGYFLSTFAMRTKPSATKSFVNYLGEVRNEVLAALEAADVPFDQVVQAVQHKRDSRSHPIFQAFFSIEPPVEPFAPGWDLTQMDVTVGAAKFDLYLELDQRPDHMAARFMYNADIFKPETIQRMAEHWLVMLLAVCRTPECSLGELPVLTDAEIAQMTGTGGWNDTARSFPSQTLHRLIEAQALRTPDAIAAIFGEQQWNYAQLMARVRVLACALERAGAGSGTVVAVLLPRSLDLLAGILAVLYTGAAYLPLDPETPLSRVALCIEDAKPVTIFSTKSLNADLSRMNAHVLFVEDVEPLPPESRSPIGFEPSANDLAYIIHTSGSTGRPKGVEISHASLVNLLTSMQVEPGFSSSDVMLAVTTISFDIAALELFLPLISGGRVVIASREIAQDPYLLAAELKNSGCTVMQATPATWRSLVQNGWNPAAGADRPLRILCGGEAITRDLAERLLVASTDLWNVYGPTETTIWSMIGRVSSGTGPVSIGVPIANTGAYVLDAGKQLVPVGVPGTLYLSGVGLARAYHGLPELTSERFTRVAAAGNARLYNTGDLAIRRSNGEIDCLGRTDNQVKVRGFRIELEGVESAVLRHPDVVAAAAKVWPDPSGGMRLSVYVVGRNGAPPDLPALRKFLKSDLPDFMIPSDVVAVKALPLTPNGKIDRGALSLPSSEQVIQLSREPVTEIERRLALIWAELLKLEKVGVDDDFFDLGGHSLLVATLQHRVNRAFTCHLSMASLFHAPLFEHQAALITSTLGDATSAAGLLRLQPKGSSPALFWLHPPTEIQNLATAMGETRPFFGLALTESDLTEMGERPTIRSIATRHVQTLLQTQPTGPIILGGFCTGGIVAFEVAAQLQERGHEVALLVLLDSQNPVFYKRIDSLAVELSKIRFYLRQKVTGVPSHKTLRQRVLYRLRKIWNLERVSTEMDVGERLTNSAAYRYAPPPYQGEVLLLRSADRPARTDHLPGWQSTVSGRIIAREVAGHHEELFHPLKVQGVAQEITAHLAAADRRLS